MGETERFTSVDERCYGPTDWAYAGRTACSTAQTVMSCEHAIAGRDPIVGLLLKITSSCSAGFLVALSINQESSIIEQ